MTRRLTIEADEKTLAKAEEYARRHNTSVQDMVSAYLDSLASSGSGSPAPAGAGRGRLTAQAVGLLKPEDGREWDDAAMEQLRVEHIARKHGTDELHKAG